MSAKRKKGLSTNETATPGASMNDDQYIPPRGDDSEDNVNSSDGTSNEKQKIGEEGKRKCVSVACEPCKRRKYKCGPLAFPNGPCTSCITHNEAHLCIFDINNDKRTKGALRKILALERKEFEVLDAKLKLQAEQIEKTEGELEKMRERALGYYDRSNELTGLLLKVLHICANGSPTLVENFSQFLRSKPDMADLTDLREGLAFIRQTSVNNLASESEVVAQPNHPGVQHIVTHSGIAGGQQNPVRTLGNTPILNHLGINSTGNLESPAYNNMQAMNAYPEISFSAMAGAQDPTANMQDQSLETTLPGTNPVSCYDSPNMFAPPFPDDFVFDYNFNAVNGGGNELEYTFNPGPYQGAADFLPSL